MTPSRLRVAESDLPSEDGRFDRFRLISWWDQKRLASARVLVIGAGALGNEIVKNLALLGIGNVAIVDLDRVENSNLSRSVLFRESDQGRTKAEVAAQAARDIYPSMRVRSLTRNVLYELGWGMYRWADIVLCGLDNREARLAVNRACWRLNRPWIDGAIEQIQGWARFFQPEGPCYECTLSETDWQILAQRRSCNLLTRSEMLEGRTPTTPTISSIIAGVQCQEAIKYLHGLDTLRGHGWVFEGLSGESYRVEYQRNPDCYSHETVERIVTLPGGVGDYTVAGLLDEARKLLGNESSLEFARDLVEKLRCVSCGQEEYFYCALPQVPAGAARCPACDSTDQREVVTFYKASGSEPFLKKTLAELGLPAMDVVFARGNGQCLGLELAGDASEVLGALVTNEEGIEWN